ncbi:hypothetical protein MLD38_024903 [Melastoma candidum]|uniref:Uncharacterized protein n=1 Tax=Melastoma candidum TaxID=119954 RepID=A0ACB9NVB2_9MYRT|nr:hypothetical protein MLD38_024903 [Melastoma candidum]
MESEWISLTDELRIDIETHRQRTENLEMELRSEKNCREELEDVVHRSVLNHSRMIEHYSELQEKHNDLVEKHSAVVDWIDEVKKAATKAGTRGKGARSAKLLAAELSAVSVERERERKRLRKENERLKAQLRDTAEAVHAAGELLVWLREAERATSAAKENLGAGQEDNEKPRKQVEKLEKKHKAEMSTMKRYFVESKLPQSALPQTYYAEEDDTEVGHGAASHIDKDQA